MTGVIAASEITMINSLWTVTVLYPDYFAGEYNSLAAAKASVLRGGFSARIDYEGRPLMSWCPIAWWDVYEEDDSYLDRMIDEAAADYC